MTHVVDDVREIKADVKELRADVTKEFSSVRSDMRSDFRWVLAAFAGLAGLMAKGFGWL